MDDVLFTDQFGRGIERGVKLVGGPFHMREVFCVSGTEA